MGGAQSAIQPLFPPSFSCMRLPERAAGRWDQKTKTLVHFLIYFWLYFVFFLPSDGLLMYPFTPQDWVDLTALLEGLNNFCSFIFVRHKSLCLKLVLKLVYKAETRSVVKGHCIWIFFQEGSFTVVINRSCFFCRTCLHSPERAGLMCNLYSMARRKGRWLLISELRRWWESEGKAKWEDETRLLLMEGKTGRIQVSGSIRV